MERNEEEDPLRDLVAWVRSSMRPETEGVLSVPQGLHDRPAFAPNVPVLGLRLQETEGGLLIPAQKEKWPVDVMAQYVTAESIFGRTLTMEQIIEDVEHSDLSKLVVAVAHLVCLTEAGSPLDPRLKDQFAHECFPAEARARVAAALRPEDVGFTSPQVGLAALKLVFKHAPDSGSDVSWNLVGPLLLIVGDHMVEPRAGTPNERELLGLEVARYSMFFREVDAHRLLARYRRIWHEIAPSLTSNENYVDVLMTFKDATGVSLDDSQALALWAYLCFGARGEIPEHESIMPLHHAYSATVADRQSVEAWLDQNAADAAWFAERASMDAFAWNFTAFQHRPLFIYKDMVVCLSVNFLIEKMTSGVFFTILDYFRSPKEKERWQRFFGDVWEIYVRQLLMPVIGDRLVDENTLKANGWPKSKKNADNIALYPERWLLVETVAKRMNQKTTATGGPDALESDLRLAVLKKAKQLAKTVEVLREDPAVTGFVMSSYPARFMCVVVLPGPFPLTPDIWTQVQDLISNEQACAALSTAGVDPLLVLDADDLELALSVSEATGIALPDLLAAWQATPLRTMSLSLWLRQKHGAHLEDATWVRRAWDNTVGPVASRMKNVPPLSELVARSRKRREARAE